MILVPVTGKARQKFLVKFFQASYAHWLAAYDVLLSSVLLELCIFGIVNTNFVRFANSFVIIHIVACLGFEIFSSFILILSIYFFRGSI